MNGSNGNKNGKSLIHVLGCRISSWVSHVSAHPFAQFGFIIACLAWFALHFRVDILTAALSILAITMTQMVLNQQFDREADAHRRDVAMHAKLDELLIASRRARDEMAGIEEKDEEEIVEMKERARDASKQAEAAQQDVDRAESKDAKAG